MIGIYFKTSLRHISKSKLYAAINILGLAAGITAMLLAILYWRNEVSYDQFHEKNPHLYRITTTLNESTSFNKLSTLNKEREMETTGGTGQVQGPAFKRNIPELKSYTRVMGGDIYSDIIVNNRTFKVHPLYVDNNFLEVFTFPVVRGNAKTALDNVSSVVLTETTAKKFFNSTDVVGKIIEPAADPSYERLGKPMVVSAIVKDPPENSSLQFDLLFPFSYMQLAFTDEAWLNAYLGTFIELDPAADVNKVVQKFNQLYAIHGKRQLSESISKYNYDPQISYGLQRMTDIHFNPLLRTAGNVESGVINGSKPIYSIMFLVISGFILLMASINFVNISIASSLKRSKEVGVRKISGGSSRQIIFQFLMESAILTCVAYSLAIVFMYSLLPLFNTLTGKQLQINEILSPLILLYFSALMLLVIGATGIYPASVLSKFKPAEVLYNKHSSIKRSKFGRSLVIFQFIPAIIMLIVAIVYYRQMEYVHSKSLGYNPSDIIRTSVYGDRDYTSITRYLKNELSKEPSIRMVSFTNTGYPFRLVVNQKNIEAVHKIIDENYLPTLEIPLLAGQNFSSTDNEKMGGAIVNEAFVKAAGLDQPLGARIQLDEYYDKKMKVITGVVKDHHFASLRVPISPMVMFLKDGLAEDLLIKADRTKTKEAIAALEKVYKAVMPQALFEYAFLDELNAREFKEEQRWQKVIGIATLCSLLICGLGLFGLAHISTYQRVKEIGIRKVLGASVSQIVILLSANFLKMVLISFVVAAPIAGIVMHNWLQDFAYRIHLGISIFLVAGILSVCVAVLAVIVQSVQTALANPVNSLRSE